MIKVIRNNFQSGFHLTFDNGLTISVQIGYVNYCETRSINQFDNYKNRDMDIPDCSSNAEIAIWDNQGNWFDFGNDTDKGWVPTEEVGQWIEKVRKAETLDSVEK